MKLIYTQENRYLVLNIQNLLKYHGIETTLKNEFIAGAAGDIAPHETWLELWLINADDLEQAESLIAEIEHNKQNNWICSQCNEPNAASFDFCWQCQADKYTPYPSA